MRLLFDQMTCQDLEKSSRLEWLETNGLGGFASGSGCDDTSSETCAGLNFEVESIPLDIYVMFDQSGSMLNDVGGLTRLQAVQLAVATFLRDQNSAGIGVGIGYFGFQPIGHVSCDANVYEKADVPVSRDHEAVIRRPVHVHDIEAMFLEVRPQACAGAPAGGPQAQAVRIGLGEGVETGDLPRFAQQPALFRRRDVYLVPHRQPAR